MKNGTNVVIVRHVDDWQNRSFIFSVPDGVTLRAGDDVLCQTKNGRAAATCLCDSFFLDNGPLEAVVGACGGSVPLKPVIGRYEYKSFTEDCDER